MSIDRYLGPQDNWQPRWALAFSGVQAQATDSGGDSVDDNDDNCPALRMQPMTTAAAIVANGLLLPLPETALSNHSGDAAVALDTAIHLYIAVEDSAAISRAEQTPQAPTSQMNC